MLASMGRLVARMSVLERVPVIGKDLLEDTPVPKGLCHHWVAPSWGIGIVTVKRFYHASPAPSTPHRLSPGHSHPPHFPLSYWDFRRLNKCKFLLCCRCCQALLRLFLPCLL